ncbi:hypothetical protein [Actinacidiphila sp. bgisy167]|uniref:hypothetical protein n=1 Tax=Actinacidiphila sp. bgisy167 TaxID=3413797 RepID=UPI003D759045
MNPAHEHREAGATAGKDTTAGSAEAEETVLSGRDERSAAHGGPTSTTDAAAREPRRGTGTAAERGGPPAARRPAGRHRPEDAPHATEAKDQAAVGRPAPKKGDGKRTPSAAEGKAGDSAPAVREERPQVPERPETAPGATRESPVPAPTAPPHPDGAVDTLRQRLRHAVGGFVDDPRQAVEEADELLGEATERLCGELRSRRDALRSGRRDGGREGGRDGHEGDDTEKMRLTLQSYRDLVDRVLRF